MHGSGSHGKTYTEATSSPTGPGLLVTERRSRTEAGPSPARRPHARGSPRLLTPRERASSARLWPEEYRLTYSPPPASSLAFSLWGEGREESTCDGLQPASGPAGSLREPSSFRGRGDGGRVHAGQSKAAWPPRAGAPGDTRLLRDLRRPRAIHCPQRRTLPLCCGGDSRVPSVRAE